MNKKERRKLKQLGYVARKVIHILVNGSVAFIAYFLPQEALFPLAVLAFVFVMIAEFIRLKTKARKLVNSTFEPVLKNREKKTFTGVFWIALAALVVSPFSSPVVMSFSFCVLAVADPAAALIGRYSRSHRIYKKKTINGSSAFLASSLLVTYIYANYLLDSAGSDANVLMVGILLTLLEMFSEPLDDNFTLLAVSALLANALLL